MSTKFKVIAAGSLLLIMSLFLYFTVRFKYIERDYIARLVATTNRIVKDYRKFEKRFTARKQTPSRDDMSSYLKYVHGKYRDIALLAITDDALSLRLSSKNDRFIRSASLFETILKDFTQDRFTVSKTSPFIIRYYDEKTGRGVEQLKFYIFINAIDGLRLLIVYPYTFGETMLARILLELLLVLLVVVIVTAAIYIVSSRKPAEGGARGARTIDLERAGLSASRGGLAAGRDAPNVVYDSLAGYIHEVFRKIKELYETESVSLYMFHSSGKLIKTMELKGIAFMRIDSVSFDVIDVDNAAGMELRNGATMMLDDGKKIILPLRYGNSFLGSVNIARRDGFSGTEVSDIKSALAGILKNIHDYILVNDMMSDPETGLHSKMYFNLRYNEALKSWAGGKDFSILVIDLFSKIEQIHDNEKNKILKLIAPSILEVVKSEGSICKYDSLLAIILYDIKSKKAVAMARSIRESLARYRIKVNAAAIVQLAPRVGVSSSEGAERGQDLLHQAVRQLAQPE
ncbi:MAG: diguanylate cyclase [Spirochaetes bacterium]|nr:diguanylate cyclase [Spirochaetota bacterium]